MQKSGWYEADGDWYYLNDYGAGAVSCWRDGTDGKPRYLKSDGKMARNEWIEDYGNWYYPRPRRHALHRRPDAEWEKLSF